MNKFSHIDRDGRASMVDVTDKSKTVREAVARGEIKMKPGTLALIKNGKIEKGAVLETARVAGIMAVKNTAGLIPMCHQLLITGVDLDFKFIDKDTIGIRAAVKTTGKTGVEMEALTGVSVAALTIYDMCKAVDREMVIGEVRLVKKSGGSSGLFLREEETDA